MYIETVLYLDTCLHQHQHFWQGAAHKAGLHTERNGLHVSESRLMHWIYFVGSATCPEREKIIREEFINNIILQILKGKF